MKDLAQAKLWAYEELKRGETHESLIAGLEKWDLPLDLRQEYFIYVYKLVNRTVK